MVNCVKLKLCYIDVWCRHCCLRLIKTFSNQMPDKAVPYPIQVAQKKQICKEPCCEILVGLQKSLLLTIKWQKLAWFRRVPRSSQKPILQSTVEGWWKGGQQCKSWSANIEDWMGMITLDLISMAANRIAWRGVSLSLPPMFSLVTPKLRGW